MTESNQQKTEYVQYGATLSVDGLTESEATQIITEITDTNLRIGTAPGEGQYIIATEDSQ